LTQEQVESAVQRVREAKALGKLVGEAPSFTRISATIPVVAQHDGTLLITGETGTGKELVARAVHYLSGRAGFPALHRSECIVFAS